MDEIQSDIFTFRRGVHALSEGDADTAKQLTEPLLKKYPFCIGIIKLMIYILRKKDFDRNMQAISELIENGLKLYPEDGELLKLRLDFDYAVCGAGLLSAYIDAFHKTINGLTRLEIQDIVSENLDSCNTPEQLRDALTVLPDSVDFIKKYINTVLKADDPEAVCRLLEFIRDKKKALRTEYITMLTAVCEYFIGKKYAQRFACVLACESGDELEKMLKNAEDTAEDCFISGEILNKLGFTSKAFKSYLQAVELADEEGRLMFLLKKRFITKLIDLRTQLDYADNLTEIDVNTAEEKPAAEGNKSRVKLVYFCKWCESFGSLEKLSKAMFKLGFVQTVVDEDFSLDYMLELLDELQIPSEYKEEETDITSLSRLKLEGPQEDDKNLSV